MRPIRKSRFSHRSAGALLILDHVKSPDIESILGVRKPRFVPCKSERFWVMNDFYSVYEK